MLRPNTGTRWLGSRHSSRRRKFQWKLSMGIGSGVAPAWYRRRTNGRPARSAEWRSRREIGRNRSSRRLGALGGYYQTRRAVVGDSRHRQAFHRALQQQLGLLAAVHRVEQLAAARLLLDLDARAPAVGTRRRAPTAPATAARQAPGSAPPAGRRSTNSRMMVCRLCARSSRSSSMRRCTSSGGAGREAMHACGRTGPRRGAASWVSWRAAARARRPACALPDALGDLGSRARRQPDRADLARQGRPAAPSCGRSRSSSPLHQGGRGAAASCRRPPRSSARSNRRRGGSQCKTSAEVVHHARADRAVLVDRLPHQRRQLVAQRRDRQLDQHVQADQPLPGSAARQSAGTSSGPRVEVLRARGEPPRTMQVWNSPCFSQRRRSPPMSAL